MAKSKNQKSLNINRQMIFLQSALSSQIMSDLGTLNQINRLYRKQKVNVVVSNNLDYPATERFCEEKNIPYIKFEGANALRDIKNSILEGELSKYPNLVCIVGNEGKKVEGLAKKLFEYGISSVLIRLF